MRTPPLRNHDTREERLSKRKQKNRLKDIVLSWISVALIVVIGVFFVGVKFGRANQPRPLPANQACLAALDGMSKALQGEAVDTASLIKACRDNQTKYEVVVAQ